MDNYAVILDNKVINRIVWDGEADLAYSKTPYEMILDNQGLFNIGMYFEDSEWKNPIIEEVGDEWQQPTSPDTLYQKGDVVIHNGETWESEVDGNFGEPGIWGWIQI